MGELLQLQPIHGGFGGETPYERIKQKTMNPVQRDPRQAQVRNHPQYLAALGVNSREIEVPGICPGTAGRLAFPLTKKPGMAWIGWPGAGKSEPLR